MSALVGSIKRLGGWLVGVSACGYTFSDFAAHAVIYIHLHSYMFK